MVEDKRAGGQPQLPAAAWERDTAAVTMPSMSRMKPRTRCAMSSAAASIAARSCVSFAAACWAATRSASACCNRLSCALASCAARAS